LKVAIGADLFFLGRERNKHETNMKNKHE